MADKFEDSMNKAIDEILANYTEAIYEATQKASDIALEEIYKYSFSCLDDYYNNYTPYVYDRTDNLGNAFIPHLKVNKTKYNGKSAVMSTVGVVYDASQLNGVYNGSKKYRPVDGAWVLRNYLEGIHPDNVWGTSTSIKNVLGHTDVESPDTKMKNYLTKYQKQFDSDLLFNLGIQVAKRMK